MMGPEALQDKNGRSAFRPTKHNAKEQSGTSSCLHNGAKLVLSWSKLGEVWQGLHFLIVGLVQCLGQHLGKIWRRGRKCDKGRVFQGGLVLWSLYGYFTVGKDMISSGEGCILIWSEDRGRVYTIHRVGRKQIILRSLEAGNTSWALTLVRWRTFAAQTYHAEISNHELEQGVGPVMVFTCRIPTPQN